MKRAQHGCSFRSYVSRAPDCLLGLGGLDGIVHHVSSTDCIGIVVEVKYIGDGTNLDMPV